MDLELGCLRYRADKSLKDVCLKEEKNLPPKEVQNTHISRLYSLKNTKEFDIIFNHGRKIFSEYFILVYSRNLEYFFHKYKNLRIVCFGIKISKKFSKKAVIRNKWRRRIKFLMRSFVSDVRFKLDGMGFIFIPKKSVQYVPFIQVKLSLEKLLLSLRKY